MNSSTLKQMGILMRALGILCPIVFGLILKNYDLGVISALGAILLSDIYKALAEIMDNQEKSCQIYIDCHKIYIIPKNQTNSLFPNIMLLLLRIMSAINGYAKIAVKQIREIYVFVKAADMINKFPPPPGWNSRGGFYRLLS